MTRRTRHTADAPGQDSFLDIVANLVGILIILVMVIGVRAKDAMIQAPATGQDNKQLIDVQGPKAGAEALTEDINQQLREKIRRQQFENAYRRKERDKILLLLTAAERLVQQRRTKLDDSQREQLQLHGQMQAQRSELQQLSRTRESVERSTAPVTVLQHLPTPMAKTVFGRELHFRLRDGRLAAVPWDALVEKLRAEAPHKVWKLKDAPKISEVAGPVDGFRMRYTLRRVDFPIETRVGVAVQRRIELDRFELIPVRSDLGEPLQQALQPGSALQETLAAYQPQQTTITVWVYPDSFDQFRVLKEFLFQKGFLTAARPLPDGHFIGGAPDGSRSAAQ